MSGLINLQSWFKYCLYIYLWYAPFIYFNGLHVLASPLVSFGPDLSYTISNVLGSQGTRQNCVRLFFFEFIYLLMWKTHLQMLASWFGHLAEKWIFDCTKPMELAKTANKKVRTAVIATLQKKSICNCILYFDSLHLFNLDPASRQNYFDMLHIIEMAFRSCLPSKTPGAHTIWNIRNVVIRWYLPWNQMKLSLETNSSAVNSTFMWVRVWTIPILVS